MLEIKSFLAYQLLYLCKVPFQRGHAMSKNIQIIINPSELGAGTRGSSLGPFAIQASARMQGSTLFNDHSWEVLSDFNRLLDSQSAYPFAKHIDRMVNVYEGVSNTVKNHLAHDRFPLLLSGDHASAGGTLKGLKAAFPNKRIGVVWIDAHADLHSPYTTPSGNLHGMPLAAAMGLDNLRCKKNDIDSQTLLHWENLKSNSFEPSDLVYVGVRSTEREEDALMAEYAIGNVSVDQLRKNGALETTQEILNRLSECDALYVSFDVDSMDPEETSLGTGTPEPNGLLVEEARSMLVALCQSPKLIALEFVEINPTLDNKTNKMAEVALKLLCACTQTLQNSWKEN